MIKYKGLDVFEFHPESRTSWDLEEIFNDTQNWRVIYKSGDCYWIKCFPYSEYHGGGQPYIIKLGNVEPQIWLTQNPDFEEEIRLSIEKKNENAS